MRIGFRVEDLPRGPEPYRVATDIGGELSVASDDGSVVFGADGIPLVEFAIFCKKWLRETKREDFYYASMDFEEEPIIAIRIQDSGLCLFESVWIDGSVGSMPLMEVRQAMIKYIEELTDELADKHNIDVRSYEGFSSI